MYFNFDFEEMRDLLDRAEDGWNSNELDKAARYGRELREQLAEFVDEVDEIREEV